MSAVRNEVMLLVIGGATVAGIATLGYSYLAGKPDLRAAGGVLLAVPLSVVTLGLLGVVADALSGRSRRTIHVFDARTGARRGRRRRAEWMDDAALSPDGARLARLHDDYQRGVLRLELRAFPSGELLAARDLPRALPRAVAFSHDASTLLVRTWSVTPEGHVYRLAIHDARSLEERESRDDGEDRAATAAAPGGKLEAVAVKDGVLVRDAGTGAAVWRGTAAHDTYVERIAWSADGSTVAAASTRMVSVWRAGTGERVLEIPVALGRVSWLDLSPDGAAVGVG